MDAGKTDGHVDSGTGAFYTGSPRKAHKGRRPSECGSGIRTADADRFCHLHGVTCHAFVD